MMDSSDGLEPISLSYWPTCASNALTWSSEGLAVAAGEVVHILTPRDSRALHEAPGHKHWHTITLRVNQFETSEWPVQEMAVMQEFSIGEELSDSSIVSLAWSPPGLGLYRRGVLAILTSNLVLSFWETNGRLGVWERTLVVNQHLSIDSTAEILVNHRRKWRIRAFCWLPTLQSSASSKWGSQILAVGTDDYTVGFFHVRKGNIAAYGQWSLELLAQHRVAGLDRKDENVPKSPSLRTILSQSSPISKIETTVDWQMERSTAEEPHVHTLILKVSLGQCGRTKCLELRASSGMVDEQPRLGLSVKEREPSYDISFSSPPSETMFNSAIQKPLSEFNEKYVLGGRVRVHYWGTAFAADQLLAAACISLHPSDMLEYGIPSSQRTTVVFTRAREAVNAENITANPSVVHERILNFVAESGISSVKTELDRNIARNAASLIILQFKDSSLLATWAESLLHQLSVIDITKEANGEGVEATSQNVSKDEQMEVDEVGASGQLNVPGPHATQETCEICQASIPFSSTLTLAECVKGHQFSRCSLSFVAIQEPGVSKYCAQCEKQFLDPGKLEFPAGPSLSQALFDEFDVCPYCQGKFRG